MVTTFAVGLLLGGLVVGSIATSAMHAAKARTSVECHETVALVHSGKDKFECPLGSTAEVSYVDDAAKNAFITCRCSPQQRSQEPEDNVDPPVEPRKHELLEL